MKAYRLDILGPDLYRYRKTPIFFSFSDQRSKRFACQVVRSHLTSLRGRKVPFTVRVADIQQPARPRTDGYVPFPGPGIEKVFK